MNIRQERAKTLAEQRERRASRTEIRTIEVIGENRANKEKQYVV